MREHLLDIYRPVRRSTPLPVILYAHGGGFQVLSKDTHWLFGIAYARHGFLVVNFNYRLAPEFRCPAAHEDAADAYKWTVEHASEFGGDPQRIVVAGESAGANIATALAVASCTERPEAWAKKVWDLNRQPSAVMPACGILQMSDPGRFARRGLISPFMQDRVDEVSNAYLCGVACECCAMADPLLIVEDTGTSWTHSLPPFFTLCGTGDPLLDDTRRLEAALKRLGVVCEAHFYLGQPHAFHMIYPLPQSRRCWADTFSFLSKYIPLSPRLLTA